LQAFAWEEILMKISKMGSSNLAAVPEHENGSKPEKAGNSFNSELFKIQDDQSLERMNELLDKITDQGKKLGLVPTYAELKTYRELVRGFIGEAVSRMYTMEKKTGWDGQGRHKMYTIIKKIDDKLAEMTEDIRSGQERQINILAKHDAIRGMLVDLYG
jgi:uncharacterized protein YaaR (DUF327 family)